MRLTKQLIKFTLVGLISTSIDVGIFFILTRVWGVPYYVTSLFSSVVAVSAGFFNNRRWTFERVLTASGHWRRQYVRFFMVYGLGIIWQNLILIGLVEIGHVIDWLAKITAVLIVAFGWNFVLAKFWVFRYNQGKLT